VPPIDPDIRGATSVRDILSKHRNNAGCLECHQKIDPLGFALENFDPIGRWRDKYAKDIRIDSRGELPGGEAFDDVAGLKQVLVARQDQFTRALAEKLLSYACGRRMEVHDRAAIDRLLADLSTDGRGMRGLVELTVLSETFRSK
jgi:hypothetical protein